VAKKGDANIITRIISRPSSIPPLFKCRFRTQIEASAGTFIIVDTFVMAGTYNMYGPVGNQRAESRKTTITGMHP
jgi:hypothetical protein